MSMLHLRLASNEDLRAIVDVVYTVLGEYGLKPNPEDTDADLKDIEESYFNRGGLFSVLVDASGAIIGTYGLYRIDSGQCELRKMYLLWQYRKMGWGRKMMDAAIRQAGEFGCTTMTLETASVLKEAIGLYKSYGFMEYRPQHLALRCDQAYILHL